MYNLILSNRFAVNKKHFWLTAGAALSASFIITCWFYASMPKELPPPFVAPIYYWDKYFLYPLFCLPFFLFIFNSFFICNESENKTIRNKLIVGYKRREIYLANFATAAGTGIVLYIAVILGSLVGIILAGKNAFEGGVSVSLYLLIGLAEVISCAALSSFLCMLFKRKAVTLIISVIVCVILVYFSFYLAEELSIPEYSPGRVVNIDGMPVEMPGSKVEDYIGEPLRTVYYILLSFIPCGKTHILGLGIAEHPIIEIVLPPVFSALITAAGIRVFNRKDLK